MSTFTRQISDTKHDGFSFNNSETRDDSSLWFGRYNNYPEHIYLLFDNVTIPQGATITAAKIQYKAESSDSIATLVTTIYANDVDSAAEPADYTALAAKVKTDASVSWTVGAWTANNWYDSPDIKSVIQEIVDRAGWASGNDLMILHWGLSGTGSDIEKNPYDYTGGASNAAKLVIDYTTATNYNKTLTSYVAATATIPRSTSKNITVISSAIGSIKRDVSRTVDGAISVTGNIQRATSKSISSLLSAIGTVKRDASKIVSSSLIATCNVGRSISKTMSSAISVIGYIIAEKASVVYAKTLSSAIAITGGVSRNIDKTLLASSIVLSNVPRSISKAIASAISATASITVEYAVTYIKELTSNIIVYGSISKVANVFSRMIFHIKTGLDSTNLMVKSTIEKGLKVKTAIEKGLNIKNKR